MKYSTDLYELVQSLSQAEKRYIKLFAQAFTSKGTENQTDLFDAIANQKTYDEELIRKQFATRISAANFHVAKNRLYNLVLRGLYLFHSGQSESEKLNQQLFQANILRRRGLYKQAKDLTDKVVEQSPRLDTNLHIPQALSTEAKILMQKRDIEGIGEYLERGLQTETAALERYINELQFQYIEMQLFYLTAKNPTARTPEQLEAVRKLAEHPLLQNEEVARNASTRALWIYRFVNGYIYRYEGDYPRAASYWEGFGKDLEENPKIAETRTTEVIGDLNNLMFLQLEARLYDKAQYTAEQLEGLLKTETIRTDLYLHMKIQERVLEFKLAYFLRTHQYEAGLAYWEKEVVAVWDSQWRAQVGGFRRLVVEHSVACLYLADNKPADAIGWIERVLSNPNLKNHEYLYASAMLVHLIIHFELGNFQFLDSLLLNTYRALYKRKLLYGTEKVIFKYLRRYLNTQTKQEVLATFQQLLEELEQKQTEQFEHILLDNFDLAVWIESKIKGLEMSKVAMLRQKMLIKS